MAMLNNQRVDLLSPVIQPVAIGNPKLPQFVVFFRWEKHQKPTEWCSSQLPEGNMDG